MRFGLDIAPGSSTKSRLLTYNEAAFTVRLLWGFPHLDRPTVSGTLLTETLIQIIVDAL